jgi:glucosylceramidase
MRVNPESRAAFIGGHLGPLLEKAHPEVRILDWDHNWDEMYSPAQVLANKKANKYVDGVAWHCYGGDVRVMAALHDAYPDKETWFTECSGGDWAPDWDNNLQFFAGTLVIKGSRGWAKGVLLWNLALDEKKGPFVGGCKTCRGVVTIDSKTGEISRNVEYYALSHASRFVRPGAHRIASTSGVGGLDTAAFRNKDGSTALLVANPAMEAKSFTVRLDGQGFHYTLPARSVATFAWKGGR